MLHRVLLQLSNLRRNFAKRPANTVSCSHTTCNPSARCRRALVRTRLFSTRTKHQPCVCACACARARGIMPWLGVGVHGHPRRWPCRSLHRDEHNDNNILSLSHPVFAFGEISTPTSVRAWMEHVMVSSFWDDPPPPPPPPPAAAAAAATTTGGRGGVGARRWGGRRRLSSRPQIMGLAGERRAWWLGVEAGAQGHGVGLRRRAHTERHRPLPYLCASLISRRLERPRSRRTGRTSLSRQARSPPTLPRSPAGSCPFALLSLRFGRRSPWPSRGCGGGQLSRSS